MADLEIDVPTLKGKSSELSSLKGKATSTYDKCIGSYLCTVGDPISGLKEIVKAPMERFKNGYEQSDTWFSNYLSDLESVESGLESFKGTNVTAPTSFSGKFEDIFGKVTMTVLKTNGDTLANYKIFGGGTIDPTGQGNGVIDTSLLGSEYSIVNTKANFSDYYTNVIAGKNLYQSANYSKYRDQCLGFAYNYAWGLYTDNRSINGSTCKNGTSYGNNFTEFKTNDEAAFKQKLYNELKAGRPVVVQVIGNRSKKTRHYVTAVGFSKNVKSASELKLTDIVLVDTYDGKVKKATAKGSSSGRYIAKGTDINSGRYNYGYQLFSIKS